MKDIFGFEQTIQSEGGITSSEFAAIVASIPFSDFINDNGTVLDWWKASVIPAEDEQPIAVSLDTVTDELGENNYENNLCSCADHLSTFTKLRVVSINGIISYTDVEAAFTN